MIPAYSDSWSRETLYILVLTPQDTTQDLAERARDRNEIAVGFKSVKVYILYWN